MIEGFIDNKYYRWYMNIICKSADVRIKGKTELHHILPESMFPEYKDLRKHKWNGVYLTYREHFVCHLLLEKATEGENRSKMFYALVRMFNGKQKFPSRTYERIKSRYKDFHWSNFKTQAGINSIYKKRGNQSDSFAGAREWFHSLSKEEQRAHHKRQAEKRCQGWWISRKNKPNEEFYVLNLTEWCKENNVDTGTACAISKLESPRYGKASKGWRIRKDGDPQLPPYKDKRKEGHENTACKGKTWKLIDGKRVWFEK